MGWNNIEEMFQELHNKNIEYIILRNYEEIDEDNFYTSGHADIDFLTRDSKKFAKVIHAIPRFTNDDGIHYIVKINDTDVVIDTRSVGDGYYDKNWELSLLENRIMKDDRFYIADTTNYYYSLIYHAILQKRELTEEYLHRLNKMSMLLGGNATSQKQHIDALEAYMREHNFYYTLPYDIHVPLRTDLVDPKRVKKNFNVIQRDFIINVLKVGSKLKHFILRG